MKPQGMSASDLKAWKQIQAREAKMPKRVTGVDDETTFELGDETGTKRVNKNAGRASRPARQRPVKSAAAKL